MPNKSLSELSTDELLKREKGLKLMLGLCVTFVVAFLATGIVLTIIKHKFHPFTALSVSVGVLIIVNRQSLKDVQKELATRDQ